MKRNPEWVEQTQREIDQILDCMDLDLNGWELEFLQDIKLRLSKTGSLTDPQENKLLPILHRFRARQ